MTKHKYLKNVTTLVLDTDRCFGCGLCEMVCPHAVFEVVEGKSHLIDKDACMECGACALNCSTNALTVNPGTGCAAAFIFAWLNKNNTTQCC